MKKSNDEMIIESCGNVFADLGLPDADEMLAKTKLALQILDIIKQRKMTLEDAASILGADQSYISKLKRGSELQHITLDRLILWLTKLDRNVILTVKEKPKKQPIGEIRVGAG